MEQKQRAKKKKKKKKKGIQVLLAASQQERMKQRQGRLIFIMPSRASDNATPSAQTVSWTESKPLDIFLQVISVYEMGNYFDAFFTSFAVCGRSF